jgi:hypothetical protein
MMDERLTSEQRWEERNFVILSLIRLHSMVCLEPEAVNVLVGVARRVREIEDDGGSISDERLLEKFMEELE